VVVLIEPDIKKFREEERVSESFAEKKKESRHRQELDRDIPRFFERREV